MLKRTKQFLAIGAVFVLICGIGFVTVSAGGASPLSGIEISLDSTHIDRIISMFEGRVAPEPEEKLGGLIHNTIEQFSAGIKIGIPETIVYDDTVKFVADGEANFKRVVQGGSVLTLSATSSTLTAAQMCANSYMIHSASTSKSVAESLQTLTFASTTALSADCLSENADMMWITYKNATTSYGASTTLTAGGDIELNHSSDTGADVIVLPQETAQIQVIRATSASTTINVEIFTAGD